MLGQRKQEEDEVGLRRERKADDNEHCKRFKMNALEAQNRGEGKPSKARKKIRIPYQGVSSPCTRADDTECKDELHRHAADHIEEEDGDGHETGFHLPPSLLPKYQAIHIPAQVQAQTRVKNYRVTLLGQWVRTWPEMEKRFDTNLFTTIASYLVLGNSRCGYKPVVEDVEAGKFLSRGSTKFGGRPYVYSGEEVGLLCTCGARKTFFLQLRADDLPDQLSSSFVPDRLKGPDKSAMFQFWLCSLCFIKSMETQVTNRFELGCRWIDVSLPSAQSEPLCCWNDGNYKEYLVGGCAERRLIGWKRKADMPSHEEAARFYDIKEMEDSDFVMELSEEFHDEENFEAAIKGVKLSGFPSWDLFTNFRGQAPRPQFVCQQPDCGLPMEQLLQVTGKCDDGVFDLNWGSNDTTVHYVLVCPNHRENIALETSTGAGCR